MENWKQLIEKITNHKMNPGITSFINPYSMLLLEKEEEVINNIDYWHVDGISLVKILNQKFGLKINRFSFDDTSLAPIIFEFAKSNNLNIALVGTKKEFIHKAVKNIEEKHQITVNYFRDGYFNNKKEITQCYDEIIRRNINIVISGMGTPLQEKFLIDLKSYGWSGYGYTCGGYLHQVSSKTNYYPPLFDKLNIRWIYRIIDEPKLMKRYFINYPLFFRKLKKYY